MKRAFLCLALLLTAIAPTQAVAEQIDIDAAKRSVVRIIILANMPDGIRFLGYGTGFAVTGDTLVTNDHVIIQAAEFRQVVAVIVPPESENVSVARIIDRDSINDLALLRIEGDLRLPPLALVSDYAPDGEEELVAIGYPDKVETALADGSMESYARSITQPKLAPATRGFYSNTEIDSDRTDYLLHSATIAPGNSGGPLVDPCGRVVGVNVAGTGSTTGGDFFFAIQNKELLPFLRANGIDATLSPFPCRSRSQVLTQRAQFLAASTQAREQQAQSINSQIEDLIEGARSDIAEERETFIAFAALLLVLAAGAGGYAVFTLQKSKSGDRTVTIITAGLSALCVIGASAMFLLRPSESIAEDRVATRVAQLRSSLESGPGALRPGELVCTLNEEASVIRSSPAREMRLSFNSDGCEGSEQYAPSEGAWERLSVPADGFIVRRAVIDPGQREYRSASYLLSERDRDRAQTIQAENAPPSCGAENAANAVASAQSGLVSLLDSEPREEWVYSCENE